MSVGWIALQFAQTFKVPEDKSWIVYLEGIWVIHWLLSGAIKQLTISKCDHHARLRDEMVLNIYHYTC